MFNTSIGMFLFGVVTALKVTLSLAQVWRTKAVSCPLTDSCPKALDARGKLQMGSFTSLSHIVLMEISDCKPIAIKFCVLLWFFSYRTVILHLLQDGIHLCTGIK